MVTFPNWGPGIEELQHADGCYRSRRELTCSGAVNLRSMVEREGDMCFRETRSHLVGLFGCATLALLCGCSNGPSAPDAALRSFSSDRILSHIRTLSSDEFEGRGP